MLPPRLSSIKKGQVAGVDSSGNLFLYFNDNKQIIEQKRTSKFWNVVGLTDSGELVWNEYMPTRYRNIRRRVSTRDGIVKDIGAPATFDQARVNNAGQILTWTYVFANLNGTPSENYLYINGVWTAPAHLNGGLYINNNGQILTYTTQYLGMSNFGSAPYAASIGVYDIATDSVVIEYTSSYNQYVSAPLVAGFNDAGDFAGTYYTFGASSSNQSAGFGVIQGQYKAFGSVNPFPTFPDENYGWVSALNNHGDTLWFTTRLPSWASFLYHADTDTSEMLSQTGIFLNDNRQFVVSDPGSVSNIAHSLATPEALMPADSISGVVMLEGEVVNAPAQPVTFEFRDAVSNQTLFTRAASVSPYGGFMVSGVPAGSYTVRVKSPKNLAQVVPVVKASGALSGVSVFLAAGDANNDNSVDATDLGFFISAYNSDSSAPGSGYDATCDFNGDGFVDATDFGLFIGNYGLQGDL